MANVRVHNTTGEAPIVRFARDAVHRLKIARRAAVVRIFA